MKKNLNEIFEIYDADREQVIIKVKADSPLKVAMFPFVSMNYAYITVTRGKNHVLTIVEKDGSTFSFSWGTNGRSLIGESLVLLKKAVINFVQENGILIDCSAENPKRADILFNSNFDKWQLTITSPEEKMFYRSNTAGSVEDMIEECERLFVKAHRWNEDIAPTGITVWRAYTPNFIFK